MLVTLYHTFLSKYITSLTGFKISPDQFFIYEITVFFWQAILNKATMWRLGSDKRICIFLQQRKIHTGCLESVTHKLRSVYNGCTHSFHSGPIRPLVIRRKYDGPPFLTNERVRPDRNGMDLCRQTFNPRLLNSCLIVCSLVTLSQF